MNTGKTLFAQLMDFLPWTTFTRIVDRYGGDHRVRTLSCAEQYRSMAFAQLTYRAPLYPILHFPIHDRRMLTRIHRYRTNRADKASHSHNDCLLG